MLEVYVDDFVKLVIPTSQEHLQHMANAIMKGIHDVFPQTRMTATILFLRRNSLKQRDNTLH
jgi:hypothetical protein